MSETMHFDTHRFVKRMTKAGMAEPTAEALADEQMALINGELATKRDIAEVHQRIAEVHQRIAETKVELLKWGLGALLAHAALLITVNKLPA